VKPRTLWSVRTRIAVACVCCAVIPLVAYATYTYVKTAHTLRDLEAVRLVEREVAVGRALDDLTTAALSSSADYASWPRLLAALGREDNTTVRRQLETLAASPGAVAQIYSTDGRLLVSGGGGAVQSSLWAVPEVKRLVTNVTGGEPTAGFETIDGKLWVVSAEYAHRYRSTRPLGVLVTARPLDVATFASLDAATDVRLTQASAAAAIFKFRCRSHSSSGSSRCRPQRGHSSRIRFLPNGMMGRKKTTKKRVVS